MQDLKYKIRASKSYDLISACFNKTRNKMEWTKKGGEDDFSDSLIDIAIEVYNKVEYGYEPPPVITFDLHNGNTQEAEAIKTYDKVFGTSYFAEYLKKDRTLPFEKSNEFSTGTRDFGDQIKTIDNKTSTCKNTFNKKCCTDLSLDNIFQLNTYNHLYGTTEIEISYFLAPKPLAEIEKIINTMRYFEFEKDDNYFNEQQEKYEKMYGYSIFNGYELKDRIHKREVPIIENHKEMMYDAVKKMNRFIEKNKNRL